ncbi:MAG: glutamate-5-semialdehyde dehydrogenase [Clostridia bacterium]|nr:glutamate-5-semialdehyde dehydrogenase [Clostridia bacterium]
MTELEKQGLLAKEAARALSIAGTDVKNRALLSIADALEENMGEWLKANQQDIEEAKRAGMKESLLDRLALTPVRVKGVADGVRQAVALPDPVGETISENVRPNGLVIRKKRVPLGVIGIIYEARPNVTVDAAALCLKSGNACILRGGKEAIRSNLAAEKIMRGALQKAGLPADCIQLVKDTSRESAQELMRLNAYVDVLIPRGGAGLIRAVTSQSSVPVIRTGEGVCHVYVDENADLDMAASILFNAKCSRPSVCNAAECVLVHENIAPEFWKKALPLLDQKNVVLRADEKAKALLGSRAESACEEDWDTEFGDYTLAVKTVKGLDEALDFIARHGTQHSECIVTKDAARAERFLNEVDAAAVYWNASTRFTDGGEFGLGAEIGISTQKLHARGPMGLEEMTSWKYVISGTGQVR